LGGRRRSSAIPHSPDVAIDVLKAYIVVVLCAAFFTYLAGDDVRDKSTAVRTASIEPAILHVILTVYPNTPFSEK
jgi:hypothetical protein